MFHKSWIFILLGVLAYAATPEAEKTHTYVLTGQAIATTNYIYRGQSQSSNAVASRMDLNMQNIFYAPGLHLNIRVNGSELGSEFDMVLGFNKELGGLIYDIGLEKFKYPQDSHRNVLEGYFIAAKQFSAMKVGLDLYCEIDSTDDEMFTSIGKMFSQGIDPRYYGAEFFLESEVLTFSLGSSAVNTLYTQLEMYHEFSWFPTWKTGLVLAYSSDAAKSMFLDGGSVGVLLKKTF